MTEQPDYLKTAWGDESVRVIANPPIYLLGATIFSEDPAHTLEALKRLQPPGARKLHWRDLGRQTQKRSLEAIAKAQQTTHIVVASPLKSNKQERARRKCLQKMLTELENQGIDKLILESRKPVLNNKDIDFLLYLRRSGIISKIELEHIEAKDNPRLLVPDQVLGAFGETKSKTRDTRSWKAAWDTIDKSIVVYNIST